MTITDIHQALAVLQEHYAVLIAAVLLVLGLLTYMGRRKINSAWLNLKTRYLLNHLGLEEISNFKFPDGLGNFFTVDRLILRQDGISLLVFKQYPGSIFCAEDIDEWTQMLEGKSYRFQNPLIDLDFQIKAISSFVPDVPVDGFLFFDHQASFPKGCPERVISFGKMPRSLKRDKKIQTQTSVMSAWKKLADLSSAA